MALHNILDWSFEPFNLIGVGHRITEQIAYKLIQEGFLPAGEYNDALIVAEAALCECKMLVSADSHMLAIQDHRGDDGFNAVNLLHGWPTVRIVSPQEIIYACQEQPD